MPSFATQSPVAVGAVPASASSSPPGRVDRKRAMMELFTRLTLEGILEKVGGSLGALWGSAVLLLLALEDGRLRSSTEGS